VGMRPKEEALLNSHGEIGGTGIVKQLEGKERGRKGMTMTRI